MTPLSSLTLGEQKKKKSSADAGDTAHVDCKSPEEAS